MKKVLMLVLSLALCGVLFAACAQETEKSDEKALLSLQAEGITAEFTIDESAKTANASAEAQALPAVTLEAEVSEKATAAFYSDEEATVALSMPWTLEAGDNTAYVEVTAEDGSAVVYTIGVQFTLSVVKDSSKELLSVAAENEAVSAFTDGKATMQVLNEIGNTGLEIEVSPKASYKLYTSEDKTQELTLPWALTAGENAATVAVTAEDGTTADYVITITVSYTQRTEDTAMAEVRGTAEDYSNYDAVKAAILALDYDNGSATYYENVIAEQAQLSPVVFDRYTQGELNARYHSSLVSDSAKATEIIDGLTENTLKSEYGSAIDELNGLLKYSDLSDEVRYNGTYEEQDAVVISGNAGNGSAEWNKSGYSQISVTGDAAIVFTVKQTANGGGNQGNVVVRFVSNQGLTLARWMIGLRQVDQAGNQLDGGHSWSDMYITKNDAEEADQFTNMDTQNRLQAANPVTLVMVRTIEDGMAKYAVYGYQEEEKLVFTGTYESTYTDDGFFFIAADDNNIVAYDIDLYGTRSEQAFGVFDKKDKGWQHYDSYTFDTVLKGDFTAEITVTDYESGSNSWNVICFPFINNETGIIESIMMPKWEGKASRVFVFEPWLAGTGNREFNHNYGDLSDDKSENVFKFVVQRTGKVLKVSMLKSDGDNWVTLFREYEVTNNFTEDDIIIGLGGERFAANVTVADKTAEGVVVPYPVHTITFDANGGKFAQDVETTAATNASDGKLSALIAGEKVTKDGFTFAGWYTAAEGGVQVTTDTVFTDNVTVYAHWTAVEEGSGT